MVSESDSSIYIPQTFAGEPFLQRESSLVGKKIEPNKVLTEIAPTGILFDN